MHGNTHGRCGNQKARCFAICRDDGRLTDKQLSLMIVEDPFTNTVLDLDPEIRCVGGVYAAIHESETVCGTDDGIALDFKYRASNNRDILKALKCKFRRIGERGIR